MFRIGQALGFAALIAGVLFISHVAAEVLGPGAALVTAFITASLQVKVAMLISISAAPRRLSDFA